MKRAVRQAGMAVVLVAFLLLSVSGDLFAQQYPTRPINVLVALPPAGSVSISFRLLAARAEKTLGQPFSLTYENGGGGSVAHGIVAKQPADGYHLVATSSSPLVRMPQFRPVPYKYDDFLPVLSWGEMQSAIYVRADSPFKTLKDLTDYAKKNPGKVTYSILGTGQPHHIAMEYIARQDGIKWTAVPTGEDPTIMLLGGHVTATSGGTAYAGHVKAGKLRMLAAQSPERFKLFPDVPTLRELGYDFINESVMMLAARKTTPPAILKKLDDTLHSCMTDPEFVKYMDTVGSVIYRDGPTTKKYLDDAYVRLGVLIRELKIPTEHK